MALGRAGGGDPGGPADRLRLQGAGRARTRLCAGGELRDRARRPPLLEPRRPLGRIGAGLSRQPVVDALVRLRGDASPLLANGVDVPLGAAEELLLERMPAPQRARGAAVDGPDGVCRRLAADRTALRAHPRMSTSFIARKSKMSSSQRRTSAFSTSGASGPPGTR